MFTTRRFMLSGICKISQILKTEVARGRTYCAAALFCDSAWESSCSYRYGNKAEYDSRVFRWKLTEPTNWGFRVVISDREKLKQLLRN